MVQSAQLLEILQQRFGFKAFRPGQLEAITQLLTHGSALCLHPTGFGKSLLYQLPATVLEGMTLVISPLLALMRDQEKQLNKRFGIAAAAINSDQTEEDNAVVRQAVEQGGVKILFVAPEQLDHVDRFQYLLSLPIDLVVVDEAHCISMWGHDFRPSYRQIVRFVQALQKKNAGIRLLGLTATADSRTEQDIKQQLSTPDRAVTVFRESMDRPNIGLSVLHVRSPAQKLLACEQLVHQLNGCGLIYCATRENAEMVAKYLKSAGINAAAYHAGFAPEEKRQLQQEFLEDKFKVLAATNALGMGIDKSNLRFIIHFDVPGSITAYYQEVGRCGRDGLPATGVLLYDPADRKIQQHFIDSAQPKPEDFTAVLAAVASAPEQANLTMIKRLTGLHPTRVTVVVAELMEQGFLNKYSSGGVQLYATVDVAKQPDLSRYATQYAVKTRELDRMLRYAEQKSECRMAILRQALGDEKTAKCERCCACQPSVLTYVQDEARTARVTSWLDQQGVEIASAKTNRLSEGIAVLDAKLRSPLFIGFMKNRATSSAENLGVPDELLELLKNQLSIVASKQPVAAIIPIPTRTWGARDAVALLLGKHLGIPVLLDLLCWENHPSSRQGELLNNDQRHFNVHQKMTAARPQISNGAVILFDDYTGSGNTLKEATRALRYSAKLTNEIIPFTIAAVKWRLGASGMI